MSVWHQDRIPGSRNRYALGTWLTYRKLASAAYVPGKKARRELYGGRPYSYVFDFPLGANGTLEVRHACPADFIAIAFCISNSQGGTGANPGCRLQIYDTKAKRRWSIMGYNDVNFAGSAQKPFLLRQPYRFRAGATILVRLQNLQASANTVQLVVHGVQDVD